jgi:two-component system, chemotaxis family, CheB/CheR fusion protein
LAQKVIPKLYDLETDGSLRVWVPACASGEEAYSIAMLFADEAARRDARTELQVFASDLDANALAIAREGRYPRAAEANIGKERLRKYFVKEDDHFRVRREIRDMVVFASHSLLKDPPFSKLHLISCRNFLIYLQQDLQQQVTATFDYALNPGGYLFLGASETAESPPGLFRLLDRDARIYVSNRNPDELKPLPRLFASSSSAGEIPVLLPRKPGLADAAPALHQRALEVTAPPSILVDRGHQIVNMSEDVGRFIQPSGGQLRNNITELVRPEFRFDLRAALHRAFEHNQPSLTPPIPVRFNGTPHRVFLQVRPITLEQDHLRQAVVFFIEGDAVEEAEYGKDSTERNQTSDSIIRRLKEELEMTRARVEESREEFENANEDLRAANEELQSTHEKYRSTAEELETSKEELQSINEELQTLNAELKTKLDGVSRTNNDLNNLMAATEGGTLFLDSDLRIKRFTPKMSLLFNIQADDEGRCILDFTHRLDYPEFTADAQVVLRDLKIVEREIGGDGSWYLTRLRPYRTIDDRIDGVVCTFVDVTERRKIQEALRTNEARMRLLLSELSHRVKNTLAVVQSMARQSFSGDVSREEGLEIFANRLRALAEAHNLLVGSDWRGADFRELAKRQIGIYAKMDSKSVILEGPAIMLPPDVATPLALMLHELATNAFKYGALSSPAGTLRLDWGFLPDAAGPEFQFRWRESGGPEVVPPSKEGFGTWLIQNGLPEARVELSFPPSGAVCTVTMPTETLLSE